MCYDYIIIILFVDLKCMQCVGAFEFCDSSSLVAIVEDFCLELVLQRFWLLVRCVVDCVCVYVLCYVVLSYVITFCYCVVYVSVSLSFSFLKRSSAWLDV